MRHEIQSEADIAAQHGLTPVSFAIYELFEGSAPGPAPASAVHEGPVAYRAQLDEGMKRAALRVEAALDGHRVVVDWQSNLEVQREMRRDIKRELRPMGDYTEERLEELAGRIVELVRQRSGR